MATIAVKKEKGTCTIELARPEVRNAFNDELVAELKAAFQDASHDPAVRVIFLRGQGPAFSAGGDLKWMQKSINLTKEENYAEAKRLVEMFLMMNQCPKAVIGLIHGAAIGGGVGLTSICDYVVASKETSFSLSEVRLGIIPAVIGPFVVSKIGQSHARAYFTSAERFEAARALQIGLIHEVVDDMAALDAARDRIAKNLLQCSPNAVGAAKSLVQNLATMTIENALDYVARTLAEIRVSPEGQEGLKAFLEKRKPSWITE